MTEFGEKLNNAINSLNSYVWVNKDGSSVKMMDMPAEVLQKSAKHCWEMLYNDSSWNVGRVVVRKNIHNIINACNTELFVRYLLHDSGLEAFKTRKDLLDCINNFRAKTDFDILDLSISNIFDGLLPEFEKITIRSLMDACFDKLGVFNNKIINDKFLLYQGIWLTNQEKVDLTEKDENGVMRDRKEVICERLNLKGDPKRLRFNQTGLSYTEFRSIVQIPPMSKISSLPSTTLTTLRDKVLLLLDNDLDHHINKWTRLLKNCMEVAKERHIPLDIPAIPNI